MFSKVSQLQFKSQEPKDLPKVGKSFSFHFKDGEFDLEDQKDLEKKRLKVLSGKESIRMWIEKILRTEKYRYPIYKSEEHNEYGVVLQELIVGHNYPKAFVEAELKREMSNALKKHPNIDYLSHWEIKRMSTDTIVSFKVHLKDGNVLKEEVRV